MHLALNACDMRSNHRSEHVFHVLFTGQTGQLCASGSAQKRTKGYPHISTLVSLELPDRS